MKLKSKKPVAFQGEHGAFSEMAVYNLFPQTIKVVPSHSFKDVFDLVINGKCEYGVVPVENTLGGMVYQVWDLLNEYKLHIIGETKIKIEHCLIVNHGSNLNDIKQVYAHYQAALQCDGLLRQHSDWIVENAYDTAGSVKMIAENGSRSEAAIASSRAAEIYRMKILKKGIQDSKQNFTRFIVLSRQVSKVGKKFTCVLAIKHKSGALLDVLRVVYKYRINLTSIHSRPNKTKAFEYNFFLEGISGRSLDDFFYDLKKSCASLKVLGVYKNNLR